MPHNTKLVRSYVYSHCYYYHYHHCASISIAEPPRSPPPETRLSRASSRDLASSFWRSAARSWLSSGGNCAHTRSKYLQQYHHIYIYVPVYEFVESTYSTPQTTVAHLSLALREASCTGSTPRRCFTRRRIYSQHNTADSNHSGHD